MANIKRHTFSKEEIKTLTNIVDEGQLQVSKAQETLGQLKRAKTNTRQNHTNEAHSYRYFYKIDPQPKLNSKSKNI